MTILEFEAWVSDHYEELKGISQTVTRGSHQGIDHLHNLIESVCSGKRPVPDLMDGTLTGWFAHKMAGRVRNDRHRDSAQGRLKGRFAQSILTVGLEDTYLDFEQEKKRNTNQNRIRSRQKSKDLGRGADAALVYLSGISGVEWGGFPGGDARWRYQQLRDDRLFEKQARQSRWDSLWATVKRQVHGLERGYSHTEFGTEEVHA